MNCHERIRDSIVRFANYIYDKHKYLLEEIPNQQNRYIFINIINKLVMELILNKFSVEEILFRAD